MRVSMNLTKFLFCLGLSVVCTPVRAVNPLPAPSGVGCFNGFVYEVRYDRARAALSQWEAEKDPLPVSPTEAIAKAREGLKSIVGGDQQDYLCTAVRLERPGGYTKHWQYLVEFSPPYKRLEMPNPKGGYGRLPRLHFIVYLSGELELPVKCGPYPW